MNETQQDRDDRDAAMHYADMQKFEELARDALIASASRPLTAEERATLAWAAHIQIEKEIRL